MVLFGVVNDDIVEVGEVDFAAQVLYELAAEFMIDGIGSARFLFADEIAVVAAAAQHLHIRCRGNHALPVTLANPKNVIFTTIDIATSINTVCLNSVDWLISSCVPAFN